MVTSISVLLRLLSFHGAQESTVLPKKILESSSDNNEFGDARVSSKYSACKNFRSRRSAAPPASSVGEDFGGLLTKDVALAADAQAKICKVVAAWKAQRNEPGVDKAEDESSLVELLKQTIPEYLRPVTDDPVELLRAIVSSVQGQALGKLLQDSIEAFPTATSIQEVLLSALLLDVDPAGGQQRNDLAGYSLRQQDNWGFAPAEIRKRFETHLGAKFGAQSAKVIAFQLLSVSAPEFLVKDLPPTLVYGSHQWAVLSVAVSRMEASRPGSSAGKTYQEIMELDGIVPVSELEKRQQQLAQMTAVTDWGVASGIILEKKDDAYAPEDIQRAIEAMDTQHTILAESVTALTTPIPTRRELALDELRRAYGSENEIFFERRIFTKPRLGNPDRKQHSLLDLYMSGELVSYYWVSSDPDFTTSKAHSGFQKLPDIKKQFDKKFDEYTQSLKSGLGAQFKYQLSLLPLKDRRLIEYGKVTTFSLQKPDANQGPVNPDHKIHKYVNSGSILIRAQLDGKTCHYLYSPAQGRIVKDADSSRQGLQFPGSRLYFSMALPDSPDGKEPPVTILWQVAGSSSPKKDPADFSAFTIYPSKSLEAGIAGLHPNPPATFSSAKTEELTGVVSAYFSQDLDEQKIGANGITEQERDQQRVQSIKAFLLGWIPFYSAVQSFIEGKPAEGFFNFILDVFGFFIPALKGGVQAVKLVGKGAMGATLSFIKGVAKAGVQAANPLAGVFDTGRGFFQLGGQGFKKLRSYSGRRGSFVVPQVGNKEHIAEGVYRPLGASSDAIPAVAVERNGKWYAFDVARNTPYGAPLRGFIRNRVSATTGLVIRTAVEVATQSVMPLAVMTVQEKLHKYYQLPKAHLGGIKLGDVELEGVESVEPVIRPVDPDVQRRVDAAVRSADEVERLSLELTFASTQEAEAPNGKWAGAPQEVVDQLEAAVELIEERTDSIAETYEFFFKPYTPDKTSAEQEKTLEQRIDAIERRIATVNKTLALAQAKRQELDSPST